MHHVNAADLPGNEVSCIHAAPAMKTEWAD